MTRYVLMLMAGLTLAGCGGGVSGEIGRACIRSDRDAANPALCSCIQRVANQSLSAADQNRAEAVKKSDTARDDAFWERYRAFADRATATCG